MVTCRFLAYSTEKHPYKICIENQGRGKFSGSSNLGYIEQGFFSLAFFLAFLRP